MSEKITKEETKSFFKIYIVINPKNSKVKSFWDMILFLSLILEILLVPYTLCSENMKSVLDSTRNLEIFIDVVFLVNIGFNLITAQSQDFIENRPNLFLTLLWRYIK